MCHRRVLPLLHTLFARTGDIAGNGLSVGHAASPNLYTVVTDLTVAGETSTDALTLALLQADPDPVQPFDPSDLMTLALTLPDDAPRPPADDPLALALTLLEDERPPSPDDPLALALTLLEDAPPPPPDDPLALAILAAD